MAATIPLHLQYQDTNGSPLEGGYLYFGVAGQNPITNPITVYWDAAYTQPAAQPIRTLNGYPSRGGNISNVFSNVNYSVLVKNSNLETVYSELTSANSFFGTVVSLTGADLVSFLQSGTGAVATTVQTKLRERISVFDFLTTAQIVDVLAGTNLYDLTVAVQVAIDAATAADKILEFPSGTYKVTDQLGLPNQTQMRGEHQHMGYLGGTIIDFQPASAKSLFVPTGLPATLKDGYLIDGFYLKGNSTTSSGNSIYAIDVDNITKSAFKNIRVSGFRTGVRCEATINNRFEFVMISNCYIQDVFYDGGYATTDVWEQCYIAGAPIGVQTSGTSVGIRWNKCIFESLDTYGVNLVKEVYGWQFTDCYGEDAPSANVSTNALFRVGFDGTTLPGAAVQLIISGGYYGGRNAGGVGALVDVDYTDGVILGGFLATRFTNVVRTSANTQTNQILAKGWVASSINTMVSDTTKVIGFYPPGVFNSGTRNNQNAFFNMLQLGTCLGVGGTTPSASGAGVSFPVTQSPSTDPNTLDDYEEYTAASTACTGAITTAVVWKATKTGNQVTLSLPATSGTATAAAYFEYGVALPTEYRPAETMCFPCAIKDNGSNSATPGMVLVSSAGAIRVYKDLASAANFTNAAVAGLGQSGGVGVSWTV